MPPKRKVGGAKPPPVQLTPEAEAELKKEIDFCVIHLETKKEGAKRRQNEQEFKKYEKLLKTLGKFNLIFYLRSKRVNAQCCLKSRFS